MQGQKKHQNFKVFDQRMLPNARHVSFHVTQLLRTEHIHQFEVTN